MLNSQKLIRPVWVSLISLLIFLIPSNLFWNLFPNSGYVHGLQVDYLLPKVFVSDGVIAGLMILWGIELVIGGHAEKQKSPRLGKLLGEFWQQNRRLVIGGTACWLAFGTRQFFTAQPLASVWFLGKLIEFGLLAFNLWNHREWLRKRWILWAWMAMLLFQSAVALGQFSLQHSVFPAYVFLGEPRLFFQTGLATGIFGDQVKLLPYGTTPHPNTLAGVLVLGSFVVGRTVSDWFKKSSGKKLKDAQIIQAIPVMRRKFFELGSGSRHGDISNASGNSAL